MNQASPLPPLTELASDEQWEGRVAAAPAEHAETLLAQADALTSGSEEERGVALRTYRILQETIDPADPSGCDRSEWVLNSLREIEPEFEPLLRRAAETAERTVVRQRAGVALGAFRIEAGDTEEGESWFLRVLAESRTLGGIPERGACLNLCQLYARQKRAFETYVMAQHAVRLFQAAADPMRVMLALTEALFALLEMREWEAYDEATVELDSLAGTLPPQFVEGAIGAVIRCKIHGLRARGMPQAALDFLDAHPPRPTVENETLDDAGWRTTVRAALYSDLGRLDEAQELFDAARDLVDQERTFYWVFIQLQADCSARRGEHEAALAWARRILDAGREKLVPTLGTGTTMRLLDGLANTLRDIGQEEAAWEALDQAAVAAVERIQEARRAVHTLPELGLVTEEDRALLARARRRFAAQHADLLKSLALLLQRGELSGERWLADLRDGEYAVVCAWCAQVKDADGTWLPVGHYLPPAGPLKLTHGMCEDCAGEWRTQIRSPA